MIEPVIIGVFFGEKELSFTTINTMLNHRANDH